MEERHEIQLGQAVERETAAGLLLSQRSYLSTNHIWAARHFAALSAREEAVVGEIPRFSIRNRAYVLGAVVESAAFIEAAINEVFQDAADEHHSYINSLSTSARTAFAYFWRAAEDGRKYIGVLDKYDIALLFAGSKPFDRSKNPHQDATLVIEIRNWMMHYRPKSFSHENEHRLATRLAGKFPPNALMAGSGNVQFPHHLLGAGCAKWASDSAKAYVDHFATLLGLQLNYQGVDHGDPEST